VAILKCVVAVGSDDWDAADSTDDKITTRALRDVGGTPSVIEESYVDIDTSTIDESWTINSVTLNFYTISNLVSPKGELYHTRIYMDATGFQLIDSSTVQRTTDSWGLITLTTEEIGWLNLAGKSSFRFTAPLSDSWGSSNSWIIRSFENITDGQPEGYWSVYLEIDYTAPPTIMNRIIITG